MKRHIEIGALSSVCVAGLTVAALTGDATTAPATKATDAALSAADTSETTGGCLRVGDKSLLVEPGTPPEVMRELLDHMYGDSLDDPLRFRPVTRWGSDAARGNPVTLTYSFAPDGVTIDANPGSGFDPEPNEIHATLNSQFGSEETWKDIVRAEFDRWSQVTGNEYVEVSDDGASWGSAGPFNGGSGRGDIRIGMVPIPGSSILAFNSFPDNGDMVLDSRFWASGSPIFTFFRNVFTHEHGHGQGLAHSCPQNGEKLMEPAANTNFLGPQFDDKISAMYLYGDRFEPNSNTASSLDLNDEGLTNDGPSFILQELTLHGGFDVDVYRVESLGATELDVTVAPVGPTYLESAQNSFTGACEPGETFSASTIFDPVVELLDPDLNVVATFDAGGFGQNEQITDFNMSDAGDWFIRVTVGASNMDAAQMYTLNVRTAGGGVVGDLDGDGCVTAGDLGIVVADWGESPGSSADFNGDGFVNSTDLGILLAGWTGTGCNN